MTEQTLTIRRADRECDNAAGRLEQEAGTPGDER